MTVTLNLFASLLERARRYQAAAQSRAALDVLRRLCAFPNLPTALAAEAHEFAGEIYLRKRCYRRARQQLRRARELAASDARTHYLLGLAWHHDPQGDLDRAARCYRRALALNPRQPRWLSEAGQLAVACGRTDEGLAQLRQAVELRPGDAALVDRLVQGLVQAGRPDDAMLAIRTALFQAPRCPKLRQIWIDLQTSRLRRDQEMNAPRASQPVLLPFMRLVGTEEDGRTYRGDGASELAGPHLVRLRPMARRRRAP